MDYVRPQNLVVPNGAMEGSGGYCANIALLEDSVIEQEREVFTLSIVRPDFSRLIVPDERATVTIIDADSKTH